MTMKTMITAGLIAGAVALATANAANAEEGTAAKEKCFGVAKMSKNDCAAADKSHSCMGHATTDGNANEWIAMPAGMCEKLVGGSLTPGAGGHADKANCEAKAGCGSKESDKATEKEEAPKEAH